MILYLDTSALVTLYVAETDSAKITKLIEAAEMPSTSRIAYAAYYSQDRRRSLGDV